MIQQIRQIQKIWKIQKKTATLANSNRNAWFFESDSRVEQMKITV